MKNKCEIKALSLFLSLVIAVSSIGGTIVLAEDQFVGIDNSTSIIENTIEEEYQEDHEEIGIDQGGVVKEADQTSDYFNSDDNTEGDLTGLLEDVGFSDDILDGDISEEEDILSPVDYDEEIPETEYDFAGDSEDFEVIAEDSMDTEEETEDSLELGEEPVLQEAAIEEAFEGELFAAASSDSATITPYNYLHASPQTSSLSMSGVSYNDAILFNMGYTGISNGGTGQIDYNFKGLYASMSFYAGYVGGDDRNASLTVIADGNTIINAESISYQSVAKQKTINLSGVSRLTIRFNSNGYDKVKYAIAGIDITPAGELPEESVLESNIKNNCEPFFYQNASYLSEPFSMGGYDYADGIEMNMGYTGVSTGTTSIVTFNFQGYYKRMTFDFARLGGVERDAVLKIEKDGEVLYDDVTIFWDDISRPFDINLENVSELKITVVSDGYDHVYYAMGNIQLTSDRVLRRIGLEETSADLNVSNPSIQLKPYPIPADASLGTVSYKSDKSIVATVDENGFVTGRHKGTANIKVSSNNASVLSAVCTINSSLPEAKYIPSRDGWGFNNNKDAVAVIKDNPERYNVIYKRITGYMPLHFENDLIVQGLFSQDYTKLFGLSNVAHGLYYWGLGGLVGHGLCHGFSATSALTYTGDFPFSEWIGWPGTAPEFPADVGTLSVETGYASYINMYLDQLIFAFALSQITAESLAQEYTHSNKYEDIINAVKNFSSTGKDPICIKLEQGVGYNHTIFPYEVIEKGNTVEIYVYDPNHSGDDDVDDQKIVLTYDHGKVTDWIFSRNYNTYRKSDSTMIYFDDIDEIADRIKATGTNVPLYNLIKNAWITTSEKFRISNSSGNTILSYDHGQVTQSENQTDAAILRWAGDTSSDISSFLDGLTFIGKLTDSALTFENLDTSSDVITLFTNPSSCYILEGSGAFAVTNDTTEGSEGLTATSFGSGDVTVRYNYGDTHGYEISGQPGSRISLKADQENSTLSFSGFEQPSIKIYDEENEMTVDGSSITGNTAYQIDQEGQIEKTVIDGIVINETSFPDDNFREFVLSHIDTISDGILSTSEADAVRVLVVNQNYSDSADWVTDLTGIGYFRNLEELYCGIGGSDPAFVHDTEVYLLWTEGDFGYDFVPEITNLDLSCNTALVKLVCTDTALTGLDLSHNGALEELDCSYNDNLKELDLSANKALRFLRCNNNNLTELTLAGKPKLKELYCSSNQLTSLDVANCSMLKKLDCSHNLLTALSISQCENLISLDCEYNLLESLDLTYNEELEDLYCNNNQLTSLDVSKNLNLKVLDCSDNQLISFTADFNPNLKNLDCSGNKLTSLEASYFQSLKNLDCSDNQLTVFNVDNNLKLEDLDCSENQLTVFDVYVNMNLETLDCSNNQLTYLGVDDNLTLEYLYCDNNQLPSLDIGATPKLRLLSCSNNRLTSLDLRTMYMPELEKLNCSGNQLTSLVVSDNPKLYSLSCCSNKIRLLDISKCNLLVEVYKNGTIDTGSTVYLKYSDSSGELIVDLNVEVIDAEKVTISKKPSIKKPAAAKGKITVKWKHFKHTSKKTKPIWKKIKKVQVQCATDKGFTNIVKTAMAGRGKTKAVIKGLQRKTTYYVRVRYYDGTGYSKWSKVKKIKTK